MGKRMTFDFEAELGAASRAGRVGSRGAVTPLIRQIGSLDSVLRFLVAGMVDRAYAATPAAAADLRAHAGPIAAAADALADRALAVAAAAAARGAGPAIDDVARAAAGLKIRAARARLGLERFERDAVENERSRAERRARPRRRRPAPRPPVADATRRRADDWYAH